MTLHTGRLTTLALAACVLFHSACENNIGTGALTGEGKGWIDASLHSEITVRNTDPQAEDYSDYNFRFVGVDGYGTSDYYRFGDVDWPMEWYFGVFRLQAESCTRDEAEAGRGRLRHEGIGENFAVVNGRTAKASVYCQVANVQVSVVFEDAMFISFKDFRLDVTSVLAPQYDEEGIEVSPETPVRTLEYDALNLSGYFNLHDAPMNLKYTLYVKHFGAEEYIESQTGHFVLPEQSGPAVLKAGDAITFRVKYTGETVEVPGVVFIVSGEWTEEDPIDNSVTVGDYTKDEVKEDQ